MLVKLVTGDHYQTRGFDRFELVVDADGRGVDAIIAARDRLLKEWDQMASPNGALRAFGAGITMPEVRIVFGRAQVVSVITAHEGGAKAMGVGSKSKYGPCPKCYSRAVHRCKTGDCVHCEWCPHAWVPS